MSSWKHLREEGRHFAKKHRVGAKRALVGVLIAAMTISTMNVPAIAEELGITADAQEQIIQDSTVNTENQSATAEGTPTEGTDATVDEGDDPADTSADAATDTTADTQPADDQQPDEAAGTESDQNNLTEGASSENDPAAVEEDTTAQVAVKVANASLKYTDANGAEQTVSENKDKVDFPTQTEIKFSVTANDGFQASRVFYTVDGADTDVAADESGTYTIPAEVVNDGLAITVEAAEIPAADEPAADDTAGEAAAAANGIETRDITGSQQVQVGGMIRIFSDSPRTYTSRRGEQAYVHTWDVSRSGIVSLSDEDHSGVLVTGKSTGTVKIIHTWKERFSYRNAGEETYTVTVVEAEQNELCTVTFDVNGGSWNNYLAGTRSFLVGTQLWASGTDLSVPTREGYVFEGWTPAVSRVVTNDITYIAQWKQVESGLTPVYVYLKVEGDTSGLVLNNSGWFTIGVIYMPENIVPSPSYMDQYVDINTPRFNQALNEALGGIVRYLPNESLVIDNAKWTELHVQAGANDYVGEGIAWHLDGKIDASYLATLTINYLDSETNKPIRDPQHLTFSTGTMVDPQDYIHESIKNYTFYGVDPKAPFEITKDGTNVINVYYTKNGDRLTYNPNGGTGQMEPSVGKAEESVTVKDNEFTRPGYSFIGWSTTPDGGVDYKPNSDYRLTDGEDVLYAVWKADFTDFSVEGQEWVYNGSRKSVSVSGVQPGDTVTYSYIDASGKPATKQVVVGDDGSLPDAPTFCNVADSTTVSVAITRDGATSEPKEAAMTINQRPVTFTGESATCVYTGSEIELTGVTASEQGENTGLLAGHSHNVRASARGINAGEHKGTITPASDVVITSGDQDVTANYIITTTPGKLVINKAASLEVTVTANSLTTGYTGDPITVKGFTDNAPDDVTVTYKGEGDEPSLTQTEAGEYEFALDAEDFEASSPNYESVTVVVAPGKLVINPNDEQVVIIVTGGTGVFGYDGTEKSVSGYTLEIPDGTTLTPSDIVCSDDAVVTRTNAGEDPMGLSAEDFACESRNYSNVVFEVTDGWIRIIAQSIDPDDQPDPDDPNKPTYNGVWISDAPSSVIYDGHSHQWAPTVLDKENGNALTYGGDYSVTYTDEAGNEVTDFTNVTGKIVVTVTGKGNYTGSVTREYQITPRTVDLIIPTQTKTYDGTADVLGSEPIVLGFEPAAQMDEGFVAGDDLTVTIAPENVKFSQADVHTDGALIADIANVVATGEDAGNYTLRNISGIGSISEHGVEGFTLTASGYAGAYDGQEHAAVSSISVTGQYQPDTEWDLTFALSEDGEYTSEVPVVTNVSDSTTVWVKASNANYGEMTVSVEAQVTPLTLTVTANNQTKVAGTADPALTSTYTGALPGETPGWTGTIARVPGEAAGTYQIFQNTLGIEDNGAFLADNYTLVFVNGTLTITAAPGGGDNPDDGGDDTPTTPTTPTTPGTTTDGGTPTVIEDAPEQPEPEQIDDDENPLAGPSESIDDDGTPLARPTHQDCWVHWLMILGIIVTAIYDVMVLIRRRKFTGTLASFEDEVLNDRNRNA